MSTRDEQHGFRLGVMWAAWWLHSGHGADQYAAWLLRESMPLATARRIAREEDYQFKRGFWQQSELQRRQATRARAEEPHHGR